MFLRITCLWLLTASALLANPHFHLSGGTYSGTVNAADSGKQTSGKMTLHVTNGAHKTRAELHFTPALWDSTLTITWDRELTGRHHNFEMEGMIPIFRPPLRFVRWKGTLGLIPSDDGSVMLKSEESFITSSPFTTRPDELAALEIIVRGNQIRLRGLVAYSNDGQEVRTLSFHVIAHKN
jgi:hypothetical protein